MHSAPQLAEVRNDLDFLLGGPDSDRVHLACHPVDAIPDRRRHHCVFVVRGRRHRAESAAALEREAERGRQLNDREYQAWQTAVEEGRRNLSKRERMLREFDRSRDPK